MRTRDADKELLVKQTAIQMLVADGFEGFSMNKLAKACNVSVATLYIYYKDKDDLIIKIAIEEGKEMNDATLRNFNADMPFAEGLRRQWENRYKYMTEHADSLQFFDQLRSSTYQEKVFDNITHNFKEVLGQFVLNAEKRGEINKMAIETYWSVAFAPLYALIRFHNQGKSMGGKPFTISNKILWETFDLVLKAFKK
ncbi:MAG: TetR/AcrR family transcriptional regulator [Taibaiella sp.]|nr:TetR/AcrR family transcriptional regulator [Taibaiella sp.]